MRDSGDNDPRLVDDVRLEEIALLTRLMIEATGRSAPLSQPEIDTLLSHPPTVLPMRANEAADLS